MELLKVEELDGEQRKDLEERDGTIEEETEVIEEKKIRKAISKLKVRKAAEMDSIPMEAWKFAGVHLEKEVIELIKTVWRKGKIPKDWKTSVMVPLHKKEDKDVTGNYRGISLLCTAYKMYAEILRNKLEKEAEEKGMIPESQAGFRKEDRQWMCLCWFTLCKEKKDIEERMESYICSLWI